ncbi:hypothetical protein CCR75_003719 [Bremia lactucae]|uniref:PDZ domain-containing protein n=1 Tax=Bremia lactucae TaxID=4779 RepID=A0A976NZ86_BRELC|nr:hypothetical protein CCR75_003719 [Bremia lactucae]
MSAPKRQIQVLLTLHDGERSFGMSLAQKSVALGNPYTVVSSVFANSPADRAGVRKGYVVRSINDKSVSGLTVAQVAQYFRNVGQARITMEMGELPRMKAAAALLEDATRSKRFKQQDIGPGTGVTPSGRAIAAPGSALAVPSIAPSKQLKMRTKLAAKTVALQSNSTLSKPICDERDVAKGGRSTNGAVFGRKSASLDLTNGPKVDDIHLKEAKKTRFIENQLIINGTSSGPALSNKEVLQSSCQAKDVSNHLDKTQLAPDFVAAEAAQPQSLSSLNASAVVLESSVIQATSVPLAKATEIPAQSLSAVVKKPVTAIASIRTDSKGLPALTTAALSVNTVSLAAPTTNKPLTESVSTKADTTITAVLKAKEAEVSCTNAPVSPVAMPSLPLVDLKSTKLAPVSSLATSQLNVTKGQAHSALPSNKKRKCRHKTSRSKKVAKKSASVEKNAMLDDDTDDDELELDGESSTSDTDKTLLTKSPRKVRRRAYGDRPRHSLTVDRLLGMGFTKEDAEASVNKFGDDPDACMVWIIAKIEERQFNEDLNRASIQSEQSKRDEAKRVETSEKESLARAEKFMALFPTSYMVSPESHALHLKTCLQSTIDQVKSQDVVPLRTILSKLLTLEGKSIRWYQNACMSYMLALAGRLDHVLKDHDVIACCAIRRSVSSVISPCVFVQKVMDEITALSKALFAMPLNQGGVPIEFLECDTTTKFDLEDDGFEVMESTIE